jgi:hypothetical protein
LVAVVLTLIFYILQQVRKKLGLKVLSNENWGKSKLVSFDPFWWTVLPLPASILFRAPMDTLTKRAKTPFQVLQHILTLSQPVGFVKFLSGQIFSVTALVGVNSSWHWYIFWTNQQGGSIFLCLPMGANLWW